MNLEKNVPLQPHNTFGIAAKAQALVRVRSEDDLRAVLADPQLATLPRQVLGGGSNIVLTARPYMEAERNRFRWYPGWFYNQPVYYRLQGNSIGFIPVPSGAFTVTLNYYPTFTKFATNGTQDASTFDGVNGWEEYAVWKAAADCIAKEENDPAYALGKVAELRARIEGLAALRDAGNAERVHDVTGDMTPWSGY